MKVNTNAQVSPTSQEKQYKKPSVGAIIGGIAAGKTVDTFVQAPYKLYGGRKVVNKINKLNKNISAEERRQVEDAIRTAIGKTGLADKGVSILKANLWNDEEVIKYIAKDIEVNSLKLVPKSMRNSMTKKFAYSIIGGNNACYSNTAKKIIMPDKDMALALFHETGHAINDNLSKVGKFLQKSRNLSLLSVPIAMIGYLKTKKGENEQPKNGFDKATTFIKNNVGKLTFITFLPAILEECLASVKGNKIAKELLSPELAKKVMKTNTLGFSTYLISTTLYSLATFAGVKVKDAIAKSKLIENA